MHSFTAESFLFSNKTILQVSIDTVMDNLKEFVSTKNIKKSNDSSIKHQLFTFSEDFCGENDFLLRMSAKYLTFHLDYSNYQVAENEDLRSSFKDNNLEMLIRLVPEKFKVGSVFKFNNEDERHGLNMMKSAMSSLKVSDLGLTGKEKELSAEIASIIVMGADNHY